MSLTSVNSLESVMGPGGPTRAPCSVTTVLPVICTETISEAAGVQLKAIAKVGTKIDPLLILILHMCCLTGEYVPVPWACLRIQKG